MYMLDCLLHLRINLRTNPRPYPPMSPTMRAAAKPVVIFAIGLTLTALTDQGIWAVMAFFLAILSVA